MDLDNNWTAAEFNNGAGDNVALDIHWAAEKSYEYFKTVHNREGYTGVADRMTQNWVHYRFVDQNGQTLPSQAQSGYVRPHTYSLTGFFLFGNGDVGHNQMGSLDIYGHEYGHGLWDFTIGNADNIYDIVGEWGALQEGVSNAWAAAIEAWVAPSKNHWVVGEEVTYSGLGDYNLSNPNLSTQPDTYNGFLWYNTTNCTPTENNDYCGTHTNAGIIQYWFYLLSEGGSGVNDLNNTFAVTGLGLTKAAQILYRAESIYHLGSNINTADGAAFFSARTATISAAIDLFGDNSCEVISLKNAWYAVGIGPAHINSSSYTITDVNGFGSFPPICSTRQYILNNQPSGSTVTWIASPSNVVSFNTSTSNPTTITKVNDGIVKIYASINSSTGCALGTSPLVSGVIVGKPVVTSTGQIMIYNGPGDDNDVCRYEGNTFDLTYSGATSVIWNAVSHQGGSWPSWTQVGDDVYVEFFTAAQNTLLLQMDASNACGTTSYQFGFHAIECGYRIASQEKLFKISPNPANSSITISSIEKLNKSGSKSITEVIVSDFSGNILIRRKFGNVKSAQLYVGNLKLGVYTVKIICGTYMETQTIQKN